MPKVRQVFLAGGGVITTGHGCWAGEEVAAVVVDVDDPVDCDICEERITEDVEDSDAD